MQTCFRLCGLCEKMKKFLAQKRLHTYCLLHKIFRKRTIAFKGKNYPYFYHCYNVTWRNERAIEVPLVWDFVGKYSKVLEIGNTLSHYFKIKHDVVDKYEKGVGVINEDAETFSTDYKYDLIVSISTFEHIGWDEEKKDPEKILRVIENLKKISKKIVVTIPLWHNPNITEFIFNNKIMFDKSYFFKKQHKGWLEISRHEIGVELDNTFMLGIIGI